jgi:hypothetical protein
MQIVILDYPKSCESAQWWAPLEELGSMRRFAGTTLPELLERARTADVLVTHGFPFRREILDYLTRPHTILVPSGRIDELVEVPIARQLGIVVAEFEVGEEPCGWIRSVAEVLRSHSSAAPENSSDR